MQKCATTKEEMMAQFNNVNDLVGPYSGSYDERNAQVIIVADAEGVVSFNPLFIHSRQKRANMLTTSIECAP
jgi:hypothetical protein